MFTLTHYASPCPEPVNSQILQMVVDYLTDISMVAIPPSNLLYNVYLGLLIGWAAGIYDTEHLTSQAASSIERLNTAFGVTQ